MNFTLGREGELDLLVLQDPRLDAETAPRFRKGVHDAVSGEHTILLDMSAVGFVDSTGLSVLLGLMGRQHQTGKSLLFFGLQQPVRSLLEVVRLDRIFEVFDSCEAACQAVLA